MQSFVKIHRKDTVAVAIRPLEKGLRLDVDGEAVVIQEAIPQGHKFAVVPIKKGQPVIKYGHPIGYATEEIWAGGWVHIHNIRTGLGEIHEYSYEPDWKELPPAKSGTFLGYRRQNGSVGVRNEIWILPTVGCVNSVAKAIEQKAKETFKPGNVEEIVAFSHPYGCSQMGDDQENTRKVLADIISHPNAGGVLVLGLGCENCNIPVLMDYIGEYDPERVKFLQCQDCEDEISEALKLLNEIYARASQDVREECSASELVIGMKCGGSDGLSGITANPTVGAFSDLLIAEGGTTILTEVPEMFGAEEILMNRCRDRETFEKTVHLINHFKDYFMKHGQTIYENPSPGNKKGGISTLEDKSLGCTQKSGSAPVCDVLNYGERVQKKGLG